MSVDDRTSPPFVVAMIPFRQWVGRALDADLINCLASTMVVVVVGVEEYSN